MMDTRFDYKDPITLIEYIPPRCRKPRKAVVVGSLSILEAQGWVPKYSQIIETVVNPVPGEYQALVHKHQVIYLKESSYSASWVGSSKHGTPQRMRDICCPYCKEVVTVYVWSLAGGGKKCSDCDAQHGSYGQTHLTFKRLDPEP